MKTKLLLIFIVGLTVLSLAAASPFAYAKGNDNHGSRVSEVARESNRGHGHGSEVSETARDNSSHDDDKDQDEDEDNNDDNRVDIKIKDNNGNENSRIDIRIRDGANQLRARLRFDGGMQDLEQLFDRLRSLFALLLVERSDDATAPVISGVAAQEIKSTEAKIVWTTNELSNSKVYFSTTTPVNLATAQTKSKGGLDINHRVSLDGLSASTTYYFIVESKDPSGNVARSTESSFKTSASAAGPVISSISTSGITSSAATVNWTTDRPANSRVYFSTSTPVNLSTATSVTVSALTTSHAVSLTGLTASTTYNFVAESTDADGLMSRSSQSSFTTINP